MSNLPATLDPSELLKGKGRLYAKVTYDSIFSKMSLIAIINLQVRSLVPLIKCSVLLTPAGKLYLRVPTALSAVYTGLINVKFYFRVT